MGYPLFYFRRKAHNKKVKKKISGVIVDCLCCSQVIIELLAYMKF